MALSVVRPLDDSVALCFALIGAAGFSLWLKQYLRGSKPEKRRLLLFWVAALCLLFMLSACMAYAQWPSGAGDTEYYHATAVRWMNEYGCPPGLANLLPTLGFNSMWLVLAAVLNHGPLDGSIAWLMGPLPRLCLVLYALHHVIFSKNSFLRIFCLCLIPWQFSKEVVLAFPSLYYDEAALFFNTLLFVECLKMITCAPEELVARSRIVLSLSAAGVMVKPLAVLSAVLSLGLVLYLFVRYSRLSAKSLFSVCVVPSVAALIWTGKNIALSGYPLYPLPLLPLSADWTLPLDLARWNYEVIKVWGRAPGRFDIALHGWAWVSPWLERQISSRDFWFSVGIPFCAALPLWVFTLIRRTDRQNLFFGAWALSCILFWFCTAPDVRFGSGFFQVFFALAAATTLAGSVHSADPGHTRMASSGVLTLERVMTCAILLLAVFMAGRGVKLALAPGKNLVSVGRLHAPPLGSRILDNSVSPPVRLWLPLEGQPCANAPLPCTSADNQGLQLRQQGTLAGGFRLSRD